MKDRCPSPNSTELAIHIGFLRGRWRGLVLAGLCFIVPAALIVAAFAWAYLRSARCRRSRACCTPSSPWSSPSSCKAIAGAAALGAVLRPLS
jgi:hypothetical protein